MRLKILSLFIIALSISACSSVKKATTKIEPEQGSALNGAYFGTIPCADCEGIEFTISLKDDFSYHTKSVYLGRDENIFETSGTYSVENDIIKLINSDEGLKYFSIKGENLLILNQARKEVTGPLAKMYLLKPATEKIEGNLHQLKIKRAGEGFGFFAIGNEPSWSLNMDFDGKFHLKSLSGINLDAPALASIDFLKSDKINYSSTTESGALEIEIRKENCQDAMSGQLFDYAVSVKARTSSEAYYSTFEGCGTFTFDLRLHDIWVLEAINGKTYTDSDFGSGLPQLEIFVEEQRFGGKDGCNILIGKIETSANIITFKEAISTKMACPNDTRSDLYRETLTDKSFGFLIKNNRLILSDSDGEKLRFKKID